MYPAPPNKSEKNVKCLNDSPSSVRDDRRRCQTSRVVFPHWSTGARTLACPAPAPISPWRTGISRFLRGNQPRRFLWIETITRVFNMKRLMKKTCLSFATHSRQLALYHYLMCKKKTFPSAQTHLVQCCYPENPTRINSAARNIATSLSAFLAMFV